MVPFAGGKRVPVTIRLALALALAVALLPAASGQLEALRSAAWPLWAAVLAKEVAIGLALGFVMSMGFWAVRSAGRLVEAQRGATRPAGPGGDYPLAELLSLTAVVIFLLLGGHRVYILALARSLEVLPLWSFPAAQGLGGFADTCIFLGGELILLALALAAPVLASLFLADLTVGWISRGWGQGAAAMAGLLPLRALAGLGLVLLSVTLLAEAIPEALERGLASVEAAVRTLAQGAGR